MNLTTSLPKPRVVVGIDFGTSRSGYAYAFIENKEIIVRTDWPAMPEAYPKTLTHLLYDKNGAVVAWGYNARHRLAYLWHSQEDSAKEYDFFAQFKMDIRSQSKSNAGPSKNGQSGRKYLVIDLVADYLRMVKTEALNDLRTRTLGLLNEHEILWCLTVPAIWTDGEKQLMRQAAQRAGMIDANDEDAGRLLLVLEPEAAAIYCHSEANFSMSAGKTFMIVDCGGGTADLTVHQVEGNRQLKEVIPGTGGPFGSSFVDKAFLEYLKERLSPAIIDEFQRKEPLEYVEIVNSWERMKCGYNPELAGQSVSFPIPTRLYKLITEKAPEIQGKLASEQNGEDDSVIIPKSVFEEMFNKVINGIVHEMRKSLQKMNAKPLDYIFVVGGFAASPLLRARIQEEFGRSVNQIVIPARPGEAVLHGAVAFGLSPTSTIVTRKARYTYGCETSLRFVEGTHDPSKRFLHKDRNVDYCNDLFSVFVRTGDSVTVNDKIERTFYPLYDDQTSVGFSFYRTDNRNPTYIDDKGCTKIGYVSVAVPRAADGIQRPIAVTMYFGRTEIEVEAVSEIDGSKAKTTLKFDPA